MLLPGPDYPAPAKLNLFLHVVGRREDGYHLLQSVFALIDRMDSVRLRARDDGLIQRVSDLAGVPASDDLAVRAALLLQEASGTRMGADIEVEKRIPMGGGMGGGSSDAATVLLALDRIWGTAFGPEALAELGAGLGADVPFFIHGANAWVEGIGEQVTPLALDPAWYLVLVPPVVVPTGMVFTSPELTRDTETLKMADFSARGAVGLEGRFHNDLEGVVCSRFPAVREHLQWLARHATARMTGSGGCVFAAFESRQEAHRVLELVPAPMSGFVAQGISHHPLRVQ